VRETFRDFERRGWEEAAPTYARRFTDVTRGTIHALLEVTRAAKGGCLLDVATGPGTVAEVAEERGLNTVGVDFSPRMAAIARSATAPVVGDVDALPIRTGAFDVALCNFGILHFAHPERAVGEMARSVRSGGRVAVTVWAPPAENVFFGLIYRALEEHAPRRPEIPASTPFFHYAEERNMKALLLAAGLVEAGVKTVAWTAAVESAESFVQLFLEGSVRTAAILRAQDDRARARITESIAAELAPGAGRVPVAAVLGWGMKP
jgi:ubiquinone/menaquinone biosynthesis C-methylase UbiE